VSAIFLNIHGGIMKKEEIIDVLNQEIKWCNENTNQFLSKSLDEYRQGFIKGLEQAILIINRIYENRPF